jgi:hypothetical protein
MKFSKEICVICCRRVARCSERSGVETVVSL